MENELEVDEENKMDKILIKSTKYSSLKFKTAMFISMYEINCGKLPIYLSRYRLWILGPILIRIFFKYGSQNNNVALKKYKPY